MQQPEGLHMQDWEKIMRVHARHRRFFGAGQADEDAYFAFFADEPKLFARLFARLCASNALRRKLAWLDSQGPRRDPVRR